MKKQLRKIRYIKECKCCKRPFPAIRKSKIYCKASCKQMDYLKRKLTTTLHIQIFSVQPPMVVKQKEGILKRLMKAIRAILVNRK